MVVGAGLNRLVYVVYRVECNYEYLLRPLFLAAARQRGAARLSV